MTGITEAQEDFLKELANIGIGSAATSLSQMVGSKVNISLPGMTIASTKELLEKYEGNLCATNTSIDGDLRGLVTIIFTDKQSHWLIDKMYGNPEDTTKSLGDEGKEAMIEFCNIIGGAFLTALSDLTQMDLMPKIPQLLLGEKDTILKKYDKIITEETKSIISVKTTLSIEGKEIGGDILMVLDEWSFAKLFEDMTAML